MLDLKIRMKRGDDRMINVIFDKKRESCCTDVELTYEKTRASHVVRFVSPLEKFLSTHRNTIATLKCPPWGGYTLQLWPGYTVSSGFFFFSKKKKKQFDRSLKIISWAMSHSSKVFPAFHVTKMMGIFGLVPGRYPPVVEVASQRFARLCDSQKGWLVRRQTVGSVGLGCCFNDLSTNKMHIRRWQNAQKITSIAKIKIERCWCWCWGGSVLHGFEQRYVYVVGREVLFRCWFF